MDKLSKNIITKARQMGITESVYYNVRRLEIKKYGNSIKLGVPKHTALPWDQRKKPWPYMRRVGIVALSREEYRNILWGLTLEGLKRDIDYEMSEIFKEAYSKKKHDAIFSCKSNK